MNTEELKEIIEEGDVSAFELLLDAMPTASTRFYRLEANMAKFLDDVRQHFPEARFYTSGGDGFALILGETHSGGGQSNNELSALTAAKLTVGGGDW